MKVLAVLFLLTTVAMVTGQSFEELGDYIENFKEEIDRGIADILDDSTDSGFPEEVDSILLELRNSVCFKPEARCVSDMYFGCNCIEEFKLLGSKCSQIPCKLVDFIYNDLATILKDFSRDVESVEEGVTLITDRIYTPLLEMSCECSEGLSRATFGCIENYDASILTETGMDSVYQMVIGMLDLTSLESVMETLLTISCYEVSGEACYLDTVSSMKKWGEMVDNSLKKGVRRKNCNAWNRVEKQFGQYMTAIEGGDIEEIVEKYVKMSKKVMCPKKCQDKMAEAFYSCCTVVAVGLAEKHDLAENLSKIIQNFGSLMAMTGQVNTWGFMSKELIERYFSTYNAAEVCKKKKKGTAYTHKRNKCERMMDDDEMYIEE